MLPRLAARLRYDCLETPLLQSPRSVVLKNHSLQNLLKSLVTMTGRGDRGRGRGRGGGDRGGRGGGFGGFGHGEGRGGGRGGYGDRGGRGGAGRGGADIQIF